MKYFKRRLIFTHPNPDKVFLHNYKDHDFLGLCLLTICIRTRWKKEGYGLI